MRFLASLFAALLLVGCSPRYSSLHDADAHSTLSADFDRAVEQAAAGLRSYGFQVVNVDRGMGFVYGVLALDDPVDVIGMGERASNEVFARVRIVPDTAERSHLWLSMWVHVDRATSFTSHSASASHSTYRTTTYGLLPEPNRTLYSGVMAALTGNG